VAKKHRTFKSGLKKHYSLKRNNIPLFGAGRGRNLPYGNTPVTVLTNLRVYGIKGDKKKLHRTTGAQGGFRGY
jgi:hypothetical protein